MILLDSKESNNALTRGISMKNFTPASDAVRFAIIDDLLDFAKLDFDKLELSVSML